MSRWYLDRTTILHEFWYVGDQASTSGQCIASWLHRKRVKCKWRRMSDENDYSNEEDSSSESESDECELGGSRSESSAASQKTNKKKPLECGQETPNSIVGDSANEILDLSEAQSDSWWEYDSESEEDDADEDYKPRQSKQRRGIQPCDQTEITIGKVNITKGETYQRKVGEDIWLVKVMEFVGEKLPIRRARCQVILYVHAAILDCFPRADPKHIRQDRRWVYEDSLRSIKFLETLDECNEDFDSYCQFVDYDLIRDRKDKLLIELKRRRLKDTPKSSRSNTASPKELVLFAGIGGCSLGDKQAGFDPSWLVEQDHLPAASLKQNHPGASVYEEDVGIDISSNI